MLYVIIGFQLESLYFSLKTIVLKKCDVSTSHLNISINECKQSLNKSHCIKVKFKFQRKSTTTTTTTTTTTIELKIFICKIP